MYSTKKIFLQILLLFCGVSATKAQTPISFSDAQAKMLHQNKDVMINDKKIEMSGYNQKSTQGLMYPHFKAFSTVTLMNKDIKVDLNDERGKVAEQFGLPNPATLGDWNFLLQKKDIEVTGISMTWPIYTGGKIRAANKAAKINTSIAETEKTNAEQELISELADRYYKAKLAEEAVKVRQQVLDGMNVHLSNADKLEKNGMIAGAEVLQAKVAVAEAERQLLGAKKDLQLAQTALAATIEDENEDYSLSSPFFLKNNMAPLADYKEMAAANYPQIQKLKLLEKLTEEGIKAENANYLPTVALTGQKILASNNFPLLKNPLIMGVGATYNLFDGFSRGNKIKAAKTQKETVILTREKVETDIKTLVEKYYNELKKSEEQIVSLQTSLQLAEELVRVRKNSFAEGIASSVDVIDAELNLSSTKLQSLKAYSDYDATLAKLYEICGISKDYTSNIQ